MENTISKTWIEEKSERYRSIHSRVDLMCKCAYKDGAKDLAKEIMNRITDKIYTDMMDGFPVIHVRALESVLEELGVAPYTSTEEAFEAALSEANIEYGSLDDLK